MKKFLSLLLALSLILSMSAVAIATTVGELVDGQNTIELPWDSKEASVYTYTATQTGTLYISTSAFFSAIGDYEYAPNDENIEEWEWYTQLTVDGQLLEGFYYGSVEVVEGQTYSFSWSHLPEMLEAKWYKMGWRAVIELSYSGEAVPQLGSETLPVELYTEQCPTDTIEVPAGGTVWYMLYYFDQAELLITGENAYVVMDVWHMDTMVQEQILLEPENGVVTVPVETYRALIQIGNKGEEPAVFSLDYRYPLGCEKNPDTLVPGENATYVNANDFEGYTYEWTAQCDGVLTLTMPEKNWTLIVYNMTTEEDGEWHDSTAGENVITVEVKKGELFWINVNYMDEVTYANPGGDVNFTAQVDYSHNYVDGVCEHCGAQENGSKERPMELYRENCPTETIEIPAGGSVWYNLYDFNDSELLVTGENAYVKATVMNMDTLEWEEVYEEAKNGVVTVLVHGWLVVAEIGNSGTEPAVFQLDYRYPLGSENNPDTLVMGENVADAKPGGFEGYTYEWTAQCDGVLTLTMPQSDWTVIVYNMTEGDEGVWFDAPGENLITIEVKKDEVFWINLNNFNELDETFLGGEIKFTASVAYAHSYVDGVCEHCGAQEAAFVQGDANGDDKVDARDARLMLRFAAKLIGDSDLNKEAADLNGDGKVDARDARLALRIAAKLD